MNVFNLEDPPAADLVLPTHALKQVAVLDTGPATAGDRSGGMAFEHRGEI